MYASNSILDVDPEPGGLTLTAVCTTNDLAKSLADAVSESIPRFLATSAPTLTNAPPLLPFNKLLICVAEVANCLADTA